MKYHQNCIDLKARTPASRISMFDVPAIVSQQHELAWLVPIMSSILQHQGMNIRAVLYQTLLCRENPTLVPQFDTQAVNETVAGVIEEQWLELLSDTDIEPLLGEGPEVRNLIHSRKGKARNNLLWNMAGVMIQTGQWRSFPSLEQAWMMLASFWGMRAPNQVPTCTVWPTLSDKEDPIRMTKYKRHIKYLESYRATEEFPAEDAEVDTTEAGAIPPTPAKPITMDILLTLADSGWNPDYHQALDYLWPIMDVSERKSFLDSTKSQRSSTSMSAMVSMPSKPPQTAPRGI